MAQEKQHLLSDGKALKNTFPKKEKLKSKKVIKELFSEGSSTFLYPFKVFYIPSTENDTATIFPQILVTVPKKHFKKAVDRNRLKRQIKEAYRLNKNMLSDSKQSMSAIGFVYVGKKKEPYSLLHGKMLSLLKKLSV